MARVNNRSRACRASATSAGVSLVFGGCSLRCYYDVSAVSAPVLARACVCWCSTNTSRFAPGNCFPLDRCVCGGEGVDFVYRLNGEIRHPAITFCWRPVYDVLIQLTPHRSTSARMRPLLSCDDGVCLRHVFQRHDSNQNGKCNYIAQLLFGPVAWEV